MTQTDLAARMRGRQTVLGYWCVLDSPITTERISRLGFDYVCIDGQHGLIGTEGIIAALMAVDAGGAAGVVRVEANDATPITRALDAGAAGVIVPLVDTAEQAAAAVSAARYPPLGHRSYGPMRPAAQAGPKPADANAATLVLVMIETAAGLANVEAICTTPGLDGIYVGPSDLCLAIGGAFPNDPAVAAEFEAALATIREAAERAGVAAGIHTVDGADAARRLGQGFTFASVAADLTHLEMVAADHLKRARDAIAPTGG